MKCKYCGADLLDTTSFCVKCGNNNAVNDGEQTEKASNEEQTSKVSHGKKKSETGVILIAIITIAVLIAAVLIVMVSLPPSEEKIRTDAEEYVDIGDGYQVTNVVVSKKPGESGGYLADVKIEAVNNENNDKKNICLSIGYSANGLKYDKNLIGEIETSICPDHKPDEKDKFLMPEIILECPDLGESAVYSATDDAITIDIDYENIVINEKTAEVPVNIHADLPAADGETSVIAQYLYEGDYSWSGNYEVSIVLQPKYTLSEDLIKESIQNSQYSCDGLSGEKLDGTQIQPGDFNIQYYDMYSRAEVSSSFNGLNDYMRIKGKLLLSFNCENDSWRLSGNQMEQDPVSEEIIDWGLSEDQMEQGSVSEERVYSADNTCISMITASSVLEPMKDSAGKMNYYNAENLIDGDSTTAWVEGVPGRGEGEWVDICLNGVYYVNGIEIANGYRKNYGLYVKNSRPKQVRFIFSDGTVQEELLPDDFEGICHIDFGDGIETSEIKMEILSTYEGREYEGKRACEDTCITEIYLY